MDCDINFLKTKKISFITSAFYLFGTKSPMFMLCTMHTAPCIQTVVQTDYCVYILHCKMHFYCF